MNNVISLMLNALITSIRDLPHRRDNVLIVFLLDISGISLMHGLFSIQNTYHEIRVRTCHDRAMRKKPRLKNVCSANRITQDFPSWTKPKTDDGSTLVIYRLFTELYAAPVNYDTKTVSVLNISYHHTVHRQDKNGNE